MKNTKECSSRSVEEYEKKVKSINIWHFLLITFIVLWMAGAYIYLNKKTNLSISNAPVLLIDGGGTNFFRVSDTNTPIFSTNISTNPFPPPPIFEVKPKYEVGDVVIVKFFYVKAVVVGKDTSDYYEILYKDQERTLHKITLPRVFLMSPAPGVLNPVSLLVD